MLMSVRTALAKLSAAAAGGALIGGAVHVAEPQTAETSYRADKSVKAAPRYVKERRAERVVPRRERTVRRVVERECCEEEQYAMVPIPLPQLPQQPIIATGGGQPIVIGGSGGFGGGFGGGFFGGFFGGSSSGGGATKIDIRIDNDNSTTGSSTSSGGSSTSTSGGSTSYRAASGTGWSTTRARASPRGTWPTGE